MRIVPVILSGGIGSRLWPLSSSKMPKQLQVLIGEHSMLQATVLRTAGIAESPIVVCNHEHSAAIESQLEAVGITNPTLILEPAGRSTAPAVAAAALVAGADDLLLILPADHVITDVEAFQEAIMKGARLAESGLVITFGVRPSRPETGYGYIEVEDPKSDWSRVLGFVEKPTREVAEKFLEAGHYLWNSGMFLLRAGVALEEMKTHAPDVLRAVDESLPEAPGDRVRLGDSFASSPAISFDYAVMEVTTRAAVVPLSGWSDVGSWASLWDIAERDVDDNVLRGDVEVLDVHGSYVRSEGRRVAVIGLDDVVVVDSGDALLVARKDRAQDVKALVERLAAREQ